MSGGVGSWQSGFDRSLTSPVGEIYWPNQVQKNAKYLFIDGKKVRANSPEVGTGQWYSSDLFVAWTTKFIKQADDEKKPFFVYLPFVNVHFPVMAPKEAIARLRGKYTQGWDALRQAITEERRVGKECVGPCRTRCWRYS